MLDELVQQLHSPDPAQRRQAITALANTKDPAALNPLAAVYRSDPEPALRDLALKAGRYIRQHAAPAPASPAAVVPLASSAVSDPASAALSGPVAYPASAVPTSNRDKELAKNYLDTGTTHAMQGDKVRAIEHLGKALALNPDLAKESFVYNLIITLTGLPVEQAIPILTHPDRRGALISQMGGKQRLKKVQEHGQGAEKATWDNVLQDFGIYFLVTTVTILIIFIPILPMFRDMLNAMPLLPGSMSDVASTLTKVSLIVMMLLSVIIGITSVVSLALQGAAIHAAAVYILGGDGTLVYLFRRIVPFQSIITLIYGGILIAMIVFNSTAEIAFLVPMTLVIGSVAIGYYMAKLVGEVYNFGDGNGCAAIMIGGVLLGALTYFGDYLMLSILGKMLGG